MIAATLNSQAPWVPYDDLALHYDRTRPGYPPETVRAIAELLAELGAQASVVADIGSGTGIFTRLVAAELAPSYRVVGVEPSDGMRRRADESTPPELAIRYIGAQSENLPFETATIAGLTAAGSAQLFDRRADYAEAGRVLVGRGLLAIVQNKRRYRDAELFGLYEAFLTELVPGYATDSFADACGGHSPVDFPTELRGVPWLTDVDQQCRLWERMLTAAEFEALALSTLQVKLAIRARGSLIVMTRLRELIAKAADDEGRVMLAYRTELTTGHREEHDG